MAASLPRLVRASFVDQLQVRTVEKDTFRFDPKTGSLRWTDTKRQEPYGLQVDGLVQKPLQFSYADLKTFPLTEQVSDFHCVEGWSVKALRWGGFRFNEITKRVVLRPGATHVVFHSLGKTESTPGKLDHYIESFSVAELLDPAKECLLALTLGGKPLTHEHGAPLRIVSPYDLGYKGSKFVTRIEFTSTRAAGWWTLANPIYPSEAPVPKSRLK